MIYVDVAMLQHGQDQSHASTLHGEVKVGLVIVGDTHIHVKFKIIAFDNLLGDFILEIFDEVAAVLLPVILEVV